MRHETSEPVAPQDVAPETLVMQIQAGNGEAERLLVERYMRPVRALLRQRLSQPADVEDYLQDTLGLALEKVRTGQVREPTKVGAFIMALARNLLTEHYRRQSRRKTEPDSEEVSRHAASLPEADTRLLTLERAILVRSLMEELPTARDREILVRFYLEEEEKQSICDDLGLSSLHFNRVLHRARIRYRQLYEDRFETTWQGPIGTAPRGTTG